MKDRRDKTGEIRQFLPGMHVNRCRGIQPPPGFTLVELLVVMAIIAILLALSIPAIQSAREAARRTQCAHRLSYLIIAVHSYESAYEFYPPGSLNDSGPIRNVAEGLHHNWISHLLPFIEENNAFQLVDFNSSVYGAENARVRSHSIRKLLCPSAIRPVKTGVPRLGYSSFAAVHHDVEAAIDTDNHGAFILNRSVSYDDITDGHADTFFLGEKLLNSANELGWMSGTSATLRNTGSAIDTTVFRNPPQQPGGEIEDATSAPRDSAEGGQDPLDKNAKELYVGGFGSYHAGGAQFAFGDGAVRFITDSIDMKVYQHLGHRSDGQLLTREGW